MAGGDDGLLRIAGLKLFRQGAKTELAADLGGLETVAAVGELQPVLVAEFFGHSGCPIAHKSSVVDLPAKADPIGDDMDV